MLDWPRHQQHMFRVWKYLSDARSARGVELIRRLERLMECKRTCRAYFLRTHYLPFPDVGLTACDNPDLIPRIRLLVDRMSEYLPPDDRELLNRKIHRYLDWVEAGKPPTPPISA